MLLTPCAHVTCLSEHTNQMEGHAALFSMDFVLQHCPSHDFISHTYACFHLSQERIIEMDSELATTDMSNETRKHVERSLADYRRIVHDISNNPGHQYSSFDQIIQQRWDALMPRGLLDQLDSASDSGFQEFCSALTFILGGELGEILAPFATLIPSKQTVVWHSLVVLVFSTCFCYASLPTRICLACV